MYRNLKLTGQLSQKILGTIFIKTFFEGGHYSQSALILLMFNSKESRVLKNWVVLKNGCKSEIFSARVTANTKRVLLESLFVLFVQGNRQLLLLMSQCKVLFSISLFGMVFQEVIITILLTYW